MMSYSLAQNINLLFKNNTVLSNAIGFPAHSLICELIAWIFSAGIVKSLTVTSAHRPGDTGVHGAIPYRGIDVRSWDMDDPQGLVDHINNHWQYDNLRPEMQCAMLHDTGKGIHIHLQVHPNTTLLRGGW